MNGVGNLVKGSQGGIGVLGGFRYVNLKEDLTVSQASVGLNDDSSVLGDTGTGHEFLQTRNQFFGGQVGSLVELRWGKFCTYLIGKAALGTMHEVVESRGDASLSSAWGTMTSPGSLLALSSTGARLTRDEFTVVPEVGINLGYQITPGLRVYAGYNFLYLSDVLRPGDPGSSNGTSGQVPAYLLYSPGSLGQSPALLNRTDYWAQGLNFGVTFRY